MPQLPADRRQLAELEVITHARLIAGGLAALGMTREDTVAVLLHHDPVYLSVVQACRIAGCRIRQINPHAAREQIGSALAEPGIRVLFVHEYFLPALAGLDQDIVLISVTPLSLFPGAAAPALAACGCHAYHQWLPLQEERTAPLKSRRLRRTRSSCESDGSAAVSGSTIADCEKMLAGITGAAGDLPPPADEA